MSYNSIVYDLPQEFTYKEKINPISMVHFRTISGSYDGSFGFDWLRIDEPLKQEPAYQDIIEGGYKSTGRGDLTKKEAYEKLKLEYERGKINYKPFSKKWFANRKYYPPYLNLFSKEYSDTIKVSPAPTYKAKLAVLVENSADIDKFEFKYNDKLFAVDMSQFQQINWETSQTAAGNIEITCLKDFSRRQIIDIYAHPKMLGPVCAEPTLAGRLIVMPNSASHRKEVKFVFVCVNTNITGKQKMQGTFSPEEQVQLRKVCYQSLVRPLIWVNRKNSVGIYEPITLDLTNDPEFKARGEYINANMEVDEDADNGSMFEYLKKTFLSKIANSIYNDCFTVFSIGTSNYDGTFGQAESIGTKNLVLFFERGGDWQVIGHEALHGFGLWHTHREKKELIIKNSDKKYIYPHGQENDTTLSTDNVMSYRMGHLKTTWKWQWDIIRKNI